MTAIDVLNDPFAAGSAATVGISNRPVMHTPLRLDYDGVDITLTNTSTLPTTVILRLALSADALDEDTAQELTERLAAVIEVRPTSVVPDQHHNIEIPVIRPDRITDDTVSWHISESLAVTHTDRTECYFELAGNFPATIDLTAPQAWRLLQALVSLDCWQFFLQGQFAHAANNARADLGLTQT
jgi:hypothetical protein